MCGAPYLTVEDNEIKSIDSRFKAPDRSPIHPLGSAPILRAMESLGTWGGKKIRFGKIMLELNLLNMQFSEHIRYYSTGNSNTLVILLEEIMSKLVSYFILYNCTSCPWIRLP